MCIGMYVLSNMANMLPHQPQGPYASAYPSIVGWLYHVRMALAYLAIHVSSATSASVEPQPHLCIQDHYIQAGGWMDGWTRARTETMVMQQGQRCLSRSAGVRVKVLTHRIGICPDEIRHAAFAWDLLKPVEDSYVIERLDRWGQPCR